MTTARPFVIAVAQLPPPVTGLSAVSQRVVDLLAERGLLSRALNVGLPTSGPAWLKLPVRAARTFRAVLLLALSRSAGASTLYMPTDSQKGLALNILVARAARAFGYRIYFHHHNFSYIDKHSGLMARLISAAPKGSAHIMLCTGMRDRFIERYRDDWFAAEANALVLPNAFMASAANTPAKPASLTIGHLSNLTVAKGALRFIALFRRLREAGVEVHAEMAGPSHEDVVSAAIASTVRDYPESFRWIGPVYGAAKDEFYDRIHVFVFPTAYPNEAQPLVLLEALAHGAAILATDIGCIGCDHPASPGGIFDEAGFDDRAFEWLQAHASQSTTGSALAPAAISAFNVQRDESLAALDDLLLGIAN